MKSHCEICLNESEVAASFIDTVLSRAMFDNGAWKQVPEGYIDWLEENLIGDWVVVSNPTHPICIVIPIYLSGKIPIGILL